MIKRILFHPLVTAIPISLVIIFLLPYQTFLYKLELIEHKKVFEEEHSYYTTLDTSNQVFKTRFVRNVKNQLAYKIENQNGAILDQFNNIDGNIDYFDISHISYVGDYNINSFKEVYGLYHRNDSIFLYINEIFTNRLNHNNIFIDTIGHYADFNKIHAKLKLYDINKDNKKEVLINITSGFNLYPRGNYIYYIDKQKLFRPKTGIASAGFSKTNHLIKNDQVYHYMIVHSPANSKPCHSFSYSDTSAWFFVVDTSLNFLYKPYEFKGHFPQASPIYLDLENQSYFYCLYRSRDIDNQRILLYKMNEWGIPMDSLEINEFFENSNLGRILPVKNIQNRIELWDQESKLLIIDSDLNFIEEQLTLEKYLLLNSYLKFHFNEEQKEFYFYLGPDYELYFFDQNYKHILTVDVSHFEHFVAENFSVIDNKDGSKTFVFHDKYNELWYQFTKDYWFYFQFLIFFAVYLGMIFFVWLIQKEIKNRVQKQLLLKTEMDSLKLKTIYNQLNPHFTFNLINSIGSDIFSTHPKTYDALLKFSNLLRTVVKHSVFVGRSIKEEIDFLKLYLDLENYRNKDDLEVKIEIEKGVDQLTIIPKMILQILAENSIKHGLLERVNKKIYVRVFLDKDYLVLSIEDNGIGRKAASNKTSNGTGKGIDIVHQYLKIYQNYYGKRAILKYEDLYNENGKASGTRATVFIDKTIQE